MLIWYFNLLSYLFALTQLHLIYFEYNLLLAQYNTVQYSVFDFI